MDEKGPGMTCPKFIVFLLLLAAGLTCCSYPFSDDEGFAVVKPGAASTAANITLANVADGDTLLIDQPVLLKYQIQGIDMSLAEVVQFTLNGKSYRLGTTIVAGSYMLIPDPGQSGVYTLTMQIITRSGSGSLADHNGAELIVYEKTWVVKLDT